MKTALVLRKTFLATKEQTDTQEYGWHSRRGGVGGVDIRHMVIKMIASLREN